MTATGDPVTADPVTAARFAGISVVRDGDGYVLGNPHANEYVVVPDIGGRVMRWLQEGLGVDECARRAAEHVGEPVDVAGFVDGLVAAGILPPDAGPEPTTTGPPAAPRPAPRPAQWQVGAGRILFGRTGLAVQAALAATVVVAMVTVPRIRLSYTDLIVSRIPLVSLVAVALLGLASGLVHEFAHVLAAAAKGVPGRITISRRLISLAYQTDLTRLWGRPRRDRVVPLLAGMLSDAATAGILALAQLLLVPDLSTPAAHVLRAALFLKVAGIVVQVQVYLRTDVYALFVVATGCRNLWDTKGALARRAIHRATGEDLALLATVGRRDIAWARFYLCLYVPGVAWTVWSFAAYAVPSTVRVAVMAIDAIRDSGPLAASGAAGIAALVLMTATTTFLLRGLLRAVARVARQVLGR